MHQLVGMGEMRMMGEMREKIYLNLPHLPHLAHFLPLKIFTIKLGSYRSRKIYDSHAVWISAKS